MRLRVSVWSAPVARSFDYMSYDIEDQAGQGSLSTSAFASVAVQQRARDEKRQRRRGESASETPRCVSECSRGAGLYVFDSVEMRADSRVCMR